MVDDDCHVLGALKAGERSDGDLGLKREWGFLRGDNDFSGEPFGAKERERIVQWGPAVGEAKVGTHQDQCSGGPEEAKPVGEEAHR